MIKLTEEYSSLDELIEKHADIQLGVLDFDANQLAALNELIQLNENETITTKKLMDLIQFVNYYC